MNEDFEQRIVREQVRLAMAQIPTMQGTSLLAALVLCYVVRDIVPRVNIIEWVTLVLLIVLGRIALYRGFGKVREGPFAGRAWKNAYLILALISGIIWGLSAFIIFPAGNLVLISLFVLVLASLSAATTISHSSIRFASTAWVGSVVVFYTIRFAIEGGDFGYTVGFLSILYLVTLISHSFKHNSFITSTITLKFENLVLFEEVRRVNDSLCQKIVERDIAQETLRESEEKFRLAFKTSPDSININRLSDGKYLDINDGFTKLTGYTHDDVIGKTSIELNIWHDSKERDHLVAGLKDTGFVENLEAKFCGKDGRILTGLMSARILRINQEDVILSITRDITERRKAEEALREREEIYRAIVDQAAEGIVLVDPETLRFVEFNDATCHDLGYSREEFACLTLFDLQGTLTREEFSERVGTLLKSGRAYFENRHRRKDGTLCDTLVSNRVISLRGRGYMAGIWQDITERKRAERALIESESKFKSFAEQAITGINIIQDGVFKYVNPRFAQMFGYTVEECLNDMPIKNLVYAEDLATVEEQIRRRISGEVESVHYNFRGLKKNGQIFPMEIYGSLIVYQGKPAAAGTILDITERKRAEDGLRESEERFSRFFRASPVGTSISRLSDGQYVDANDAFLRLLGYTREEIIGHNSLELGMWVDPKNRAKMVEILKEQGRIQGSVTQLVRKSGEIIDVLGFAEVIEIAGETCILSLAYDMTERKRGEEERKKLEEQLFQAQKMESIGRLAGGVAHDFNNILGVIIGRAEMALEQDDSTDKDNLKEILKAGRRSADLVRQLLAFARKQTAVPKILDLNDTISGMLNMLRRLIGEDIDLFWVPELDLWKVKIDPSQVDQILANLVVNARDAISEVGAITMRTENVVIDNSNRAEDIELIPGNYVRLTVSDTGEGMSEEVREKIFEPFFTTKGLGKGTGLGLATVYGIVRQNQGFISVNSEPGKGTTFKIYLPRYGAGTAQVPLDEAAVKRQTGTETVLLVEDNEAILDLNKMILEKLGYTVLAAQTPVHAIHLAKDHPGDLHLLLTDVVMPEMHGRALAEQLSVIRPSLKFLYMSGYTADVITHQGILDDGVNFLQKPFGIGELAARVRHVLDHLE